MDIALLKIEPFAFEVPELGRMTLDATKGRFLVWVERQLKRRNLTGQGFTEVLLKDYVHFVDARPSDAVLASLSSTQLDVVADAISLAAGYYFVGLPKSDGDGQAALSAPDLDSAAKIGVEVAAADRLLADVKAWYERATARVRNLLTPTTLGALASFEADIQKSARILQSFGTSPALKYLREHSERTKWLRDFGASPLGQSSNVMAASAALNAWADPMNGAFKRFALIDDNSKQMAIGRVSEIWKASTLLPNLTVMGEVQKQLGLFARYDAPFARIKEMIAQADRFPTTSFYDKVKAANLAALSELTLNGTIAAGIGADLLNNFESDPSDETPYFAEALRRGQTFDSAPDLDELLELIHRLIDKAQAGRADGEAIWVGRLSILGTILAIVLASVALHAQLADHSESYLKEIAQREKALVDQNARLLDEQVAAREERARQQRLRYVPRKTPLRNEPRGEVVRIIYPDQTLIVVQTAGDWAQVEVFTYDKETLIRGWVHRGNIRLMPAS